MLNAKSCSVSVFFCRCQQTVPILKYFVVSYPAWWSCDHNQIPVVKVDFLACHVYLFFCKNEWEVAYCISILSQTHLYAACNFQMHLKILIYSVQGATKPLMKVRVFFFNLEKDCGLKKLVPMKGVNLNCLNGRILFISSPLIEEAVLGLKKKRMRAAWFCTLSDF